MAVIQIAKIQVRSGLQENLPQLDTGELGWSVDERRLYIGNGTLAEGAPATGVTEILTEYSNNALTIVVDDLGNVVANLQTDVSSLSYGVLGTATLTDNTTLANIVNTTTGNSAVTITSTGSRTLDYSIVRGTASRTGTMKISHYNGSVTYEDDYTETAGTGVTLSFFTDSSNVVLQYTTTSTSSNATFKYYLKPFA